VKILIGILLLGIVGCVTATQSEDGKTLKIKGLGAAKFENGAEISSKPIDLSQIKVQQ